MPGRRDSYTTRINGELKMRVIDVLNEASDFDLPTIEWIKCQDLSLQGYSTQKMSRILGDLVQMGLVRKGRSKSLGKMVYRLTSRMIEDGYKEDE